MARGSMRGDAGTMKDPKQAGFTYLMLLWWVAISSVMLAAMGQQWALEGRRQKEIELEFRGQQIQRALNAYYNAAPEGQKKSLPKSLDDLLQDERGRSVRHHLRQLWPDPITGKPWGLVRDGPFVRGVFSTSTKTPVRALGGRVSYQQWTFEAELVAERTGSSCHSSTNRHSTCID